MHISIVALSSIVAASSVLGAPAPDLESRGVDVGIIVWVDSGYNGATAKLVVADGQCLDLDSEFADKVSSVAPIDGSDCKIYASKGCTGKELTVTRPTPKLGENKFNNMMSSFTCKHHFVPGPPPLAPPHHDAVDLGCYQQSLPGGPGGSQGVPWATIRIGGKTCTGPFDNSAGVCFGGRDKWGPLKKCDGATFFLDTSGKKSKWTVVWKDEMVQSCEVDKKAQPFSNCIAPAIN